MLVPRLTIFQWPREPNVKGDWNKKGVRVKGKNAVCRNGPPSSNQTNGPPIDLISPSVYSMSLNKFKTSFLSVSDAPEIEQEETFIHTGEGDETEVICVVHSSPKADVSWFKVRTHQLI